MDDVLALRARDDGSYHRHRPHERHRVRLPGRRDHSVGTGAFSAEASATPAGATYDATVLSDSPVLFWKLNETSGTSAVDHGSGGYTGTYQGGYTLGETGIGDGETSVLFDGSSGNVTVASGSGPQPATGSIEIWGYWNGSAEGTLMGDTTGRAPYLSLSSSTGTPDFGGYSNTNGAADCQGPAPISADAWHHFVGTYDGTTLRLYLDGALDATLAWAGPFSYATNAIMAAAGSFGYFGGKLAKMAVYDTVLSAARVLAHYEAA